MTSPDALERELRERAYSSWKSMRYRCRPGYKGREYYHARGIGICERWELFENFYADLGPRPVGTTLDRIDNDRGYEPGNCRWATIGEQAVNKRKAIKVFGEPLRDLCKREGLSYKTVLWYRTSRGITEEAAVELVRRERDAGVKRAVYKRRGMLIEHNGERRTIAQWARTVGMPYEALLYRIRIGESLETALTRKWGKAPHDDSGRFMRHTSAALRPEVKS